MTRWVGLTGGIGSGKSTVAALFQTLGVPVLDSDVMSHQLTQANGLSIPAIQAEFGAHVLDANGALNRRLMRELIFTDPAAKLRLQAILHPLIRAQLLVEAESIPSHAPYLLWVVPLLFESQNYRALVQRSVLVDCDESSQITRTMQRSQLAESEVRAIMAQQMTRHERRQHADDILLNEGDICDLQQQVNALHQRYLTLGKD
jgi:dephospho-CoA kinase